MKGNCLQIKIFCKLSFQDSISHNEFEIYFIKHFIKKIDFCSFKVLDYQIWYHIAQNSGRVKLWRINHFRVLARKTLANLQLYISHFSESGIWLGKILANDVPFAKFAKVFPRQNFALYGIWCSIQVSSNQ